MAKYAASTDRPMSTGATAVAVVAQTKEAAIALTGELGLGDRVWAFGARSAAAFEGLRAGLVIIDVAAQLERGFLSTIRATVAKMGPTGGRVLFVSRDAPLSPPAALQAAFWEALKRCDEDRRIPAVDTAWRHDGHSVVTGELPELLWEHMAELLADRTGRGYDQRNFLGR